MNASIQGRIGRAPAGAAGSGCVGLRFAAVRGAKAPRTGCATLTIPHARMNQS